MGKYTSVIFDVDGTLVDSTAAVVGQLGDLSEEFGHGRWTDEALINLVHTSQGSLSAMTTTLLGKKARSAEAIAAFTARHAELFPKYNPLMKPYLGAIETLSGLERRGYNLAIFTSRPQWILDSDHAYQLLAPYFKTIIALEHAVRPKPHPDGVVAALVGLGCKPKQALMVGDMPADIKSAHAAGVHAAALTHGYGSRQSLAAAGPEYTINTLSELLPILA